MFAVLYVLRSFQAHLEHKHVRALIDNTTAVACITHMGTSQFDLCNRITKTIWEWCIAKHIWISTAHIPGIENVRADKESPKLRDKTEWMLNRPVFNTVLEILHLIPDIDLFASVKDMFHINQTLRQVAVDAFLINWKDYDVFYAFLPFSLITQVFQKIQSQQVTGLLMLINYPLLIPP